MGQDRHGERRKHFRGSARPGRRVEIKFRAKGDAGDHESAITRNIGVGGAFIVTEARPKVGSLIELIIDIPDHQESLLLDAEVRWIAPGEDGTKGGLGVRFVNLEVRSLLALSEYFSTLINPLAKVASFKDS